ncbi:MAG TPA: protein kinase [Ktedonobacteraceae bacterium]|nr:protein kinase [Ktedonobacteraceae bacterium]
METGRVISRRYLLEHPIQQGQICAVFSGMDQVLQRRVAVKVVPAAYIPTYQLAIKMTASFSHPNIVGIYDIVPESEAFYIVQEYVTGEDFPALLRAQLSPYEVADLGCQICKALIYAASPSRHTCHGDLTPGAIMRERSGLVRVNNFALPSDLSYFESWSPVGGSGVAISDRDQSWGQLTEGRRDDDTRAVGLLLYQLLTSRPAGATTVEPPPDGGLRFARGNPPELCETVARAVVRLHPQHISTPEALYENLKILADRFEPPILAPAHINSTYAHEEPLVAGYHAPANPGIAPRLATRDTEQPVQGLSSHHPEQQSIKLPAPPALAASPTVADFSHNPQLAHQAAYPELVVKKKGASPALLILVMGLVAFALFFLVGYFAGQFFFH